MVFQKLSELFVILIHLMSSSISIPVYKLLYFSFLVSTVIYVAKLLLYAPSIFIVIHKFCTLRPYVLLHFTIIFFFKSYVFNAIILEILKCFTEKLFFHLYYLCI